MMQIIQDVRSGATTVKEIPAPIVSAGQVLLATSASVISAGTERYVVDLARKSLIGKARQRPQDVKRVLQKMRREGILSTLTQVSARLDDPMPLGYSAAGVVLECGAGVQEFKPGDRIAAATAHSAISVVGRNLCALMPENVSFEQAAYTSIAAIGLQGVRLARAALGDSVLVIGLGLIGQMCVCLLKAQGCRVFGIDLDPAKLELAHALGADAVATGYPLQAVKDFSGSFGVDAVVLTAATESNEPIEFAAEACRTKGRIVLVGVVGLQIPRPPFFKKELEFTVSSSLGPGRGDPIYEEKGVDYPVGYARWTAQRNMQAVLDLMSQGKLPVEKLTSHRFSIDQAPEAYDLIISRREPFLGLLLEYADSTAKLGRRIELRAADSRSTSIGVSLIGAGNFARLVMLPELMKMNGIAWRGICTAKGLHAEHTGRTTGFEFATTDAAEIWNDKDTVAVFIATRHDLHAELVIAALRAGKHVFVEKPLCIHAEELERIAACIEELGDHCPLLTVGFNRRFAPATKRVKEFFAGAKPLSLSYRFSPGYIPAEHWTQDEEVGGGRIVGEACHAIDTCVAIAGSPPVKVYAESVAKSGGIETSDDRVFITLRHADGSISSVSYQTGGDSAFPAERIEVMGGGRTAVIDAWHNVELWRNGKLERLSAKKDKGHSEEFAAFLSACRNGGPAPIPWEQLYGVAWASLMAMRSLREGQPLNIEASVEET
jgi:predicted dehydrogenase/threonine dehydrogenase-like Zn-dependent dehydrogenase